MNINRTGNVRINVTMRRVRVTIVAVQKQEILHILSVCLQPYSAFQSHAPHYIVICGLTGPTMSFCIN